MTSHYDDPGDDDTTGDEEEDGEQVTWGSILIA